MASNWRRFEWLGSWKMVAIILIPFVFVIIPLLATSDDEKRRMGCVYVMIVTGLYWMLDCMPLPAAGFIPLAFLPLFKVNLAPLVAQKYMRDNAMMTFLSCIVVLGAQSAGLAKRIALKILSLVDADFRKIAVMMMVISLVFSMWFVNTAIMLFMMKVIDEIIGEMKDGITLGTLGEEKMYAWKAALESADNAEINVIKISTLDEVVETEEAAAAEDHIELEQDPATDSTNDQPEKVDLVDGMAAHTDITKESSKLAIVGSSASGIGSRLSFGSPRTLELSLLYDEAKSLLESYKLTLYHCVAMAANVGGLFWPYTSTGSSAIYLIHRNAKKQPRVPPTTPPPNPSSSTSAPQVPAHGFISALDEIGYEGLWMSFTFPIILITFPIILVNMDLMHFRNPFRFLMSRSQKKQEPILESTAASPATVDRLTAMYKEKYQDLGKFSSHERGSLILISLTIMAILLRNPVTVWGWGNLLTRAVPPVILTDSTIVALATLIGFVTPKCGSDMLRGPKGPNDKASFTALVGWKAVQKSFPWGILIIIGAQTAIADAVIVSNLGFKIYNSFIESMSTSSPALVLFVSMMFTVVVSNTLGNITAAYIAATVLSEVSNAITGHRCYLTYPCIAVSSFSFLFPAGTGPMAIAYNKNYHINGWYCIRKGWLVTILCVLVVYLFGLFYTEWLYCISIADGRTKPDPFLTSQYVSPSPIV